MTSISHLYRILNSVPERTLEATMEELKKYDFVYDNTEQEKKSFSIYILLKILLVD